MRAKSVLRHMAILITGSALALAYGCQPKPETPAPTTSGKPAAVVTPVRFDDATQKAGIAFKHTHGGFGKKWLPETMGSGVAWIDYDGDGYQDVFFVNSREWTAAEKAGGKTVAIDGLPKTVTGKLYRNKSNGEFEDVTAKVGLDVPMYGMGVCSGDFDNDGRTDLYVTGLGRNYLFQNKGGTFTEIAAQAGVKDSGWSTSAAWLDYDKDGKLDLVVGHYVNWSPATDIPFPRSNHLTYGTPQQYVGQPLALYHNEGSGKFKNVSKEAGMLVDPDGRNLQGKTLGVCVCDYDGDGYPDIACANDTEPNYLFHNEQGKKFAEKGVVLGMALPDSGLARGAMGIDACDYDRKGKESLVIGNFSNQGLALYHNEGEIFRDVAVQSGVFQPTLLSLTFGVFFLDVDNDGWPDVFVANGHVDDDVQEVQPQVGYAQEPHLFLNTGGQFAEVTKQTGTALMQKYVARGAAYADYELSGMPGFALSTSNGAAHLMRNSSQLTNKSLRLELEGTKSNRSAIGAKIDVKRGESTQAYHVRSGSSYCSQSELPVTVGLGTADAAEEITITWPSGEKTTLPNVAAGQIYHVVEGKGISSQKPFGQPVTKTARLNKQGNGA